MNPSSIPDTGNHDHLCRTAVKSAPESMEPLVKLVLGVHVFSIWQSVKSLCWLELPENLLVKFSYPEMPRGCGTDQK